MVRKYADPVQVRRATQCRPGSSAPEGWAGEWAPEGWAPEGWAPEGEEGCAPETFVWRGRLYVVRAVLGHWWERQAWWVAAPARSVHGLAPEDEGVVAPDGAGRAEWGSDREVWRVEASPGRAFGTGVYDLGCPGDDAWLLLRVAD
jgi:hypothetical protein